VLVALCIYKQKALDFDFISFERNKMSAGERTDFIEEALINSKKETRETLQPYASQLHQS
jgi:hypothetical protein